jgi:hypothetical protein
MTVKSLVLVEGVPLETPARTESESQVTTLSNGSGDGGLQRVGEMLYKWL